MSGLVNLVELSPGMRIRVANGGTAEVVENPKDGMWVIARYVTSPEDPAQVGQEEMVFAQDVVEIVEGE